MTNIAPTQSNDNAQLTKPADWAIHMVTASLKFNSANTRMSTYPTPDAARLDILNTLNWFEAHDEYAWPDFTARGFDFNQAMRFRRALVNDVFAGLQKAGTVRITSETGGLATPNSERGRDVRGRVGDGSSMAERKRQCKRLDDSDTEVDSDEGETSIWNDKGFLAEVMIELVGRTQLDLEDLSKSERVAETLADLVQDSIVESAL
ncbi:hypothetical protein T440DRAFT_458869 [Plenodomus tracheiphilus IPT5]|uniref:Uncharacterized protein n=1 Tax=Plenodomus tracheiphilus IPT5 TaxID=1408161 RepID=A0A6A7AVP2_9PLEO|nr:hypothetical protein T440DRAFT_458869 [Plenodomus tracheiphilus IPT5]